MHEHDWKPDGDSWGTRNCDCKLDGEFDKADHIINHSDHYVRKRRYTCHCGKSKTVTLQEDDSP